MHWLFGSPSTTARRRFRTSERWRDERPAPLFRFEGVRTSRRAFGPSFDVSPSGRPVAGLQRLRRRFGAVLWSFRRSKRPLAALRRAP
jgi:hypothetical protein